MQAGRISILLAEDNRGDVYVVRDSLREHGIAHDLIVARDGEEAFRLIESIESGAHVPDLILLDLNLPKFSGQEVLRRLRASPPCGSVPIIIITSSDSSTDRDETAALGARAYFRKPSRLDEFMRLGDVVKQVLREPGLNTKQTT